MTVFQRIVRVVKPQLSVDLRFENYYSQLLRTSGGTAGLPSASEAQRDLNDMRDRDMIYRYM